MENFLQDLRYGARILLKNPGFTLIAVATLALGIGANTAIFSVTDKLLIRSLPVKNPQQLVLITSVSVSPHFVSNAFSYPEFSDYRAQNEVFSGLLAFTTTELELDLNNQTERVASEYVSGNYFDVLGVRTARGRAFSEEEDRAPGTQPVVVVSDAFWRKRFGADPNLIGQTITLNGFPLTVIGVAAREFNGMILEEPTEIWVPALMHPQLEQSKFIESRTDRWLLLLGRVKDDITQPQAEFEMDALAQQIKEASTPAGTITKGLPFSEQHVTFERAGQGISILRKRFSSPLMLLMGVVGLVLLIACANVAALLLARAVTRRKEMAIRLAVGASGWRLGRQLLTESLLLASAGGAAGLLLAPWLVTLLVKTQARLVTAQTLLDEGLDRRVLLFTAFTTLLAGVVFGIVPAWQSSRADLIPALKEEGGVSNRRDGRFNLRSLLVVAQLALAIVVLIGAGLCIKTVRNLVAIDPGYQAKNLLVVPLELEEKKYNETRGRGLQQEVIDHLASIPGVEAVSYGLVTPISGSRYVSTLFVEGRQPLPDEQMAFDANFVGPRYHETMGIRLAQGRGFTEQDRAGAPRVVIINEAMAQRFFPGEDAMGKRLNLGPGQQPLEIVGITSDIKHHELTEAPLPHFDLPALQRGYDAYTNVLVRAKGRPVDLIPAVRGEIKAIDSSLPVSEIRAMSEQIGNTLAATRLASTLVGVFGVVALLLAAIGLYGVMAYTVSRRTREIGIRVALGASSREVMSLVIRQGMVLTVLGVMAGLVAAFISTRLTEGLLYGVSPTDLSTFVVVALLLSGVALAACWIPARRATKVDPMIALRYE
ncbi:MAG: ABC transporter permease [Blastocatellia bacterium]